MIKSPLRYPGGKSRGVKFLAEFIPPYQTFREVFFGDSPKPRLTVGIGVNWVSPFGPLRIDIAKALLKQKGDDTKVFNFNVGTQF